MIIVSARFSQIEEQHLHPGMVIGSWESTVEKHSTSESADSEEARKAPSADVGHDN